MKTVSYAHIFQTVILGGIVHKIRLIVYSDFNIFT